MPIREGLARLEGVESISSLPCIEEATCALRMRRTDLLDPREVKQQLAALRVGARLRGVEAVVDGFVEKGDTGLTLRIPGVPETLLLKPLERKVQWDSRRRRPQEPSRPERVAFNRLCVGLQPRSTAVRVIGPLFNDEPGRLALEVRESYFFGHDRPVAPTATLGIDVNGPYGLGEPWLALRAALQGLRGVEAVAEHPDLRSTTMRLRLRHSLLPDLHDFAEAVSSAAVGASLRGVEITFDGSLLETDRQLALQAKGAAAVVPLAPMTGRVGCDPANPGDPYPTLAETKAFDALRAEWKSGPRLVRIIGRCVQRPNTRAWLVEVRRYSWHPASDTDNVDAETVAPKLGHAEQKPDRDPPSPPANLVATFTNGIIRLEWEENTEDDLYNYVVYRSTAPGQEFIQLTAGVSTNGYTLYPTARGATHHFVVTAQDTSGNRSAYSSIATVTLPRERED